jgi:anti-anti-sigma factor
MVDWPRGDLRLSAMTVGHRTVVRAEGEIDLGTVAALREVLAGHVDSGLRELWIDLSNVRFMDSQGVRVLMETHEALTRDGRRLTVICGSGPVRRVLELLGVDRILAVFPTRTSAQRAS